MEKEKELPSVVLTERAAQVFKDSCEAEGLTLQDTLLRIGARPGGCSGWKYSLDYDDTADPTDLIFEQFGVKLIVNEYILNDIIGDVEVDYRVGNLVEQGFIFKRLKYEHVCGCGDGCRSRLQDLLWRTTMQVSCY